MCELEGLLCDLTLAVPFLHNQLRRKRDARSANLPSTHLDEGILVHARASRVPCLQVALRWAQKLRGAPQQAVMAKATERRQKESVKQRVLRLRKQCSLLDSLHHSDNVASRTQNRLHLCDYTACDCHRPHLGSPGAEEHGKRGT